MLKNFINALIISWSCYLFSNNASLQSDWIIEEYANYNLYYKIDDKENIEEYRLIIDQGISKVNSFFEIPYISKFNIYVYPNRESLDRQWQKDWNMPDFKSQCWMVASGVSNKLDMISPKRWDNEACEHIYAEKIKTERLITHELFHVYHGQQNMSPYFSEVYGIDWFVEGLATYAAGQCDTIRMQEIKNAYLENKIPTKLDDFWTGNLRYGLSGSMVMYLDVKYGREKLLKLLKYNKKEDLLSDLKISEQELLVGWNNFIKNNYN